MDWCYATDYEYIQKDPLEKLHVHRRCKETKKCIIDQEIEHADCLN